MGVHELLWYLKLVCAEWRIGRFYRFLSDSCDLSLKDRLLEVGKVMFPLKKIMSFVKLKGVVEVFAVGFKFCTLQLIEACLTLLVCHKGIPQVSKSSALFIYLFIFGWSLIFSSCGTCALNCGLVFYFPRSWLFDFFPWSRVYGEW